MARRLGQRRWVARAGGGTTGTGRLEGRKAEVNNRGVEDENGGGPGQAERGDQVRCARRLAGRRQSCGAMNDAVGAHVALTSFLGWIEDLLLAVFGSAPGCSPQAHVRPCGGRGLERGVMSSGGTEAPWVPCRAPTCTTAADAPRQVPRGLRRSLSRPSPAKSTAWYARSFLFLLCCTKPGTRTLTEHHHSAPKGRLPAPNTLNLARAGPGLRPVGPWP